MPSASLLLRNPRKTVAGLSVPPAGRASSFSVWRRASAAFALPTLVLLAAAAAAQNPPMPTFGTTVVMSSGLEGQIYFLRRNTGDLPNLKKHKPVGVIYTTQLNVPPQDFKRGFPGITDRFEWFAIEYTGKFWIDDPGLYQFSLTADDGAQLFIDDRLIIDNGGTHPPLTKNGSLNLTAGLHRIRVPYFQGPRFLVALVLKVARPGEQNFKIFNTDDFKPSTNLDSWPKEPPASPGKPDS